jgi:2-oxoglutarate/2-oxoacid ferredoxin oxidoreductase subunit alpha
MRELIDGATAVARGALDAGCNFFAGYPISPATPLLLHMIRELPKTGGIAIQAEDEIAALSMCIGAAMTGRRALTATSGPGISLYSENIGLAIMGETPLVIVDAQRLGPATGGATTPGQGDVQFVRWGTSGGYPIIALAPGSVAECYALTRAAFSLAERFRVPVFLLTDKEMFQSLSTVEMDSYAQALSQVAAAQEAQRAFPPIGGKQITRFTGSTHDEDSFLTKDPAKVRRLNDHLRSKIEDCRAEIELVKADLQPGAKTLFIAYGITARAMAEAARVARGRDRAVSTLAVQTLWPVPEDAIIHAVEGGDTSGAPPVERIVVAELNLGDFRREVERVVYRWAATGRRVPPEIIGVNRIDGELITPDEFLLPVGEKAAS